MKRLAVVAALLAVAACAKTSDNGNAMKTDSTGDCCARNGAGACGRHEHEEGHVHEDEHGHGHEDG